MKEMKRFDILCEREVPMALDRRILAAATESAAKLRFRHALRKWTWSTVAVAAAFLIGGTIVLFPDAGNSSETSRPPHSELLALNDWTGVEQEAYNLSFQLYTGRQEAAELANLQVTGGFQ